MAVSKEELRTHFRIHTASDLDFVIGESHGLTVGMESSSTPELKRRVLAAISSVLLGLQSIDTARKNYVSNTAFETDEVLLGDQISQYINSAHDELMNGMQYLQSLKEPTYGRFGAEISLYRVPYIIKNARLLANRGVLLEAIPLLRQALEMIAWSYVAFRNGDANKVDNLKAQSCIGKLKEIYPNVGNIYGFLSQFTHWGRNIHTQFIGVKEGRGTVLQASIEHRALALALCLVLIDILVEVLRALYGSQSEELLKAIQSCTVKDTDRNTFVYIYRKYTLFLVFQIYVEFWILYLRKWRTRQDSNLWPLPSEGNALSS
tara:strand:+ start:817 stop:1773 length:957 start_codon:yes stop_codon:yes gene_type:complete